MGQPGDSLGSKNADMVFWEVFAVSCWYTLAPHSIFIALRFSPKRMPTD